jgi:hypothetical protein
MIENLTKKIACFFFFLFLFCKVSSAQTTGLIEENHMNHGSCATPPLNEEQVRYILDVVTKQAVGRNAGTTCVPIQAHILRRDDGTGGLNTKDLNEGLANLNYMYKPANIEFYWSPAPKYVDNTDYYVYSEQVGDDDTEAGLKALLTIAPNAINVCYLSQIVFASGNNTTGLASGPSNNASSNFVWLHKDYHNNAIKSIAVHEFGHYFSLPHTFQGTELGNASSFAENVPRTGLNANCSTKGDLICDTEADPRGTSANCVYTGGASDINGVPYTPPIGNIMSYYSSICGALEFTPNQYTRIAQALATRLTHTAYTLTSSPMVVNNPSGLTVTQSTSTSAAVLNWTDNAANEVGYLIERSSISNTSGFVPVTFGGTAENITTFNDATVSTGTTYYYRVKASNDQCNDYSNVVSFTPTLNYCQPTIITPCKVDENGSYPRYIGSVKLKTIANATIFEKLNSGCNGPLSDFTSVSGNVVAGVTYNLTVNVASINGCYEVRVGVWLDINNDKDFDDVGEYLGNGVTSGCGVTIPITIPIATSIGSTRFRIRCIGYNETMVSTASCGNFSAGEVEDYTLVVGAALPIELLAFKATKHSDKSTLISWNTASEKDVDKLILQVSNDANNYSTLIEMLPKGSQNRGAAYQFEHTEPFKGVNYYRLIERDLDGRTKQVAQGSVLFTDKSFFNIQPNPTQGTFTLDFYTNRSEKADIMIFDILGRVVFSPYFETQIGDNQLIIELPSTLPDGVYFVRLNQNGILKTAKLKKQS